MGDAGSHDYSLDFASSSNPNYNRWVADICSKYLGSHVLDLGAGYGVVTEHLAHGRRVVALDLSEACTAAMSERFRDHENVRVVRGDLRALDAGELFDSVVMLNVLEHIQDDVGVLRAISAHVKPGGTIVLYVPANDWLFTAWDRQVGHYRRYSTKRLAGVIDESGLSLVHIQHVNMLGIPSWMFSGRVLKMGARAAGPLSIWDKYMTPLTRGIESHVRAPFGLNMLCVAGVPDAVSDS